MTYQPTYCRGESEAGGVGSHPHLLCFYGRQRLLLLLLSREQDFVVNTLGHEDDGGDGVQLVTPTKKRKQKK